MFTESDHNKSAESKQTHSTVLYIWEVFIVCRQDKSERNPDKTIIICILEVLSNTHLQYEPGVKHHIFTHIWDNSSIWQLAPVSIQYVHVFPYI